LSLQIFLKGQKIIFLSFKIFWKAKNACFAVQNFLKAKKCPFWLPKNSEQQKCHFLASKIFLNAKKRFFGLQKISEGKKRFFALKKKHGYTINSFFLLHKTLPITNNYFWALENFVLIEFTSKNKQISTRTYPKTKSQASFEVPGFFRFSNSGNYLDDLYELGF
jgi:hypothetical protein